METRKSDLLPSDGELDAPVLRQPPLGNVEPGHDLDARGDGGGEPRRRAVGLVQHAIIAVANPQPVLEWLDMDVGGLGLHGAGQKLVDQPDHRGLAGQILQPLGIFQQWLGGRVGLLHRGRGIGRV